MLLPEITVVQADVAEWHFDPDTGLEVKPLRKCRRVCILKHLHMVQS